MKTIQISFSKLLLTFGFLAFLSSCDSRYQGNKDTQIDSAAYKSGHYDVDNSNRGSGQETYATEPVSTNNAVKINVPIDDQFWGNFRAKYHIARREGQVAELLMI